MHRITSKKQFLTQENVQFDGTLYAGYWTIYSMSVGVNVGLDLVPISFGVSGGWGETKFFNNNLLEHLNLFGKK